MLAPRTAPGLVGAVSRRVLERALSGIENGALELRAPDGARRFGDPDAVPVVMEVHDPRFFARLARSGRLAVGEGYQAGEWSSPDLPGLVALLARNQDQVFGRPPLSVLAGLGRFIPRIELPRGLRRAERDVHAHYDLGNAFFSLWLDDSMTYSCALFDSPELDASPKRSRRSTARSPTPRASGRTTACSRSAAAGAASRSTSRASAAAASRRRRSPASSTRWRPSACARRG